MMEKIFFPSSSLLQRGMMGWRCLPLLLLVRLHHRKERLERMKSDKVRYIMSN